MSRGGSAITSSGEPGGRSDGGKAGADGQRQRGVFDVDEDRALEALRLAWGDAYAVCSMMP